MYKKKHPYFFRQIKVSHKTKATFANQAATDIRNEYRTMLDNVSRIFYETQKGGGTARVTICIKQL